MKIKLYVIFISTKRFETLGAGGVKLGKKYLINPKKQRDLNVLANTTQESTTNLTFQIYVTGLVFYKKLNLRQ